MTRATRLEAELRAWRESPKKANCLGSSLTGTLAVSGPATGYYRRWKKHYRLPIRFVANTMNR